MPETNMPPAERDVLACLHRHGETTSKQIQESLAGFRPMAIGSVITLLRRLETKGLVTRTKPATGKGYLFKARQAPRVTLRGLARHFVKRVFHGDNVALMASLFDTQPPTREEAEKLQRLLDELRERRERKGDK
jgi:predicted transcriptional regulator